MKLTKQDLQTTLPLNPNTDDELYKADWLGSATPDYRLAIGIACIVTFSLVTPPVPN